MLPDIIETARLRLRPFRLRDVDDVLVYATDPEWARYLPVPQPYTQADAEKFIAGQVLLDCEVHPAWAIEHAGAVIGGINLRFHFDHHIGEMGYSIARNCWGRGLATEAARAVMEAAFAVYTSLNRIRAMADARNIGSLRVMEKLGMVREGVLRQNRLVRGEYIDEVWCGMLRPEWDAQRQRRDN
jgi:[ribosomal protein S5]-alanine N-acetyltransferase